MICPLPARRRFRSRFEELESRFLLSPIITIALNPVLDRTGQQAVLRSSPGGSITDYGIFDTGASSITFSAGDRGSIPVKVQGGATAGGLGGAVVGDVSQPTMITADSFTTGEGSSSSDGGPVTNGMTPLLPGTGPGSGGGSNGNGSGNSGIIQAFLGTASGSPQLPTLVGTPILAPYVNDPSGMAALISMGSFLYGGFAMNGVTFVASGTSLAGSAVQIPLTLSGPDNHMSPGSDVTRCPVPLQDSVTVVDGSATVSQQQFLFDTGAQVSVISPATATALGLDLKHPAGTMSVEGVGGAQDVPTFVVSAIEMPTTNGGLVQFTNVPVAVLNLAEGIEGVLGMNLFKGLSSMLYDPYGPGGAVLSFGSLVPPSGMPNNGSAPLPGQLSQLPPAWQNAVAGTSVFGFEFDSGVVSGRLYNDLNADGRIEGNESGLAGQVVYLDVHSDARLDPGDLVTTTASDGTFQFTGLTPGTYTVREVAPAGMLQSLAAPLAQTVQVANGRPVSVNFGNVTAASGANQAFVSGLYSSILDREPDSGGLAGWTGQLNAGVSRGTVANAFWLSAEHRGMEVTSYFETYLGRAPDASGLQAWTALFQAGASEIAVQEGILASGEFQAAHASSAAYIQALYADVLGRQAASGEIALWSAALSAGTSRMGLAVAILTSRESYLDMLDGLYGQILHRGTDNDGIMAWLTILQQGQLNVTQVAEAFLNSAEFASWTGRQYA
jgi:hypothetical protein